MTSRKKFEPIEFYRSATAKAWFWRVKARNGRIVADSAEGYSSEAKARKGFEAASKMISAAHAAGKRVTLTKPRRKQKT